jgi:beta-N-acetylhexosaminidase
MKGRYPTTSASGPTAAALGWPRRAALFVALLVIALFAAACTTRIDNSAAGVPATSTTEVTLEATTSTTVTVETVDPVSELISTLSVEEKIGQLLMPTVFGTGVETTPSERELNLQAHGYATPAEIVAAYSLGGVIYLESNVASAQQLKTMSSQLQDAAAQSSGIGLLVAIDQEGGRVSRISDEVTSFPPASDLAGGRDPRVVREASYVTGQQVQQQGVNVVLAPVADVREPGQVSFIGNRSFGEDPSLVASMVAAAVDGLQQSGVAAAVKHWPGHGATSQDSHEQLPTLDVDRSLWESRELPPFAAAIDEGVAIVLVGHLALPQLDPTGDPATISPVLVEELLRQELGYDGVVMTDALNMGAVADIPEPELAVASVQAGIDVILIPPSLSAAADALTRAVESGEISEARLDQSVARILRLKQSLGLLS